MKKMVEDNIR